MYVIGSDRVTVTDGCLEPSDVLHAVDADGRVACRDRGTTYTFPARRWRGEDPTGPTCLRCAVEAAALHAPADTAAYPGEADDLRPGRDGDEALLTDGVGF